MGMAQAKARVKKLSIPNAKEKRAPKIADFTTPETQSKSTFFFLFSIFFGERILFLPGPFNMTEEVELYQTFSLVRASAKVLVSVAKSSVVCPMKKMI